MTALDIVRAIHFASLMVIFGVESLRAVFRGSLSDRPHDPFSRNRLAWCAGAALVTAIAWLALVGSGIAGTDAFDVDSIWLVARQTLFGHVMMARLAILVALLAAIMVTDAHLPRVVLSGLALAAISLTSHAAAAGDQQFLLLRAANDAVHLLAAAFWVGSLAALVPIVIAQRRSLASLAPALRAFSFWGMIAVSLLVVAGALNAYLILFSLHAHWSPAYVGLLALKLTLAAVMVSLALVNRFHLLPGIEHQRPESAENMIASSVIELVVGIAIVVIVSILGTLAPSPM